MPKARRRPVSSDKRFRRALGADTGPKERWQHSGRALELTEKAGTVAARATEEHIVDFMVLRRLLTQPQREAALRFKLDFQRAGLAQHVTGSYTPMRRGDDFSPHGRERDDREEASYQRWRNAIRELGMRYSSAVISMACNDVMPLPREVQLLQKGLDLLVDWYGLPDGK